TFGPDIASSSSALDKQLVSGVAQFGPYGAFGVPTYEATDVEMKAIASVCKRGQTPSRSNVLAAIRKTDIAPGANPLAAHVSFKSNGDLVGQPGDLFKIAPAGKDVT